MKTTTIKSAAIALSLSTILLSGCAIQSTDGKSAPALISLAGIQGKVYGGQQPIVGAAIQLYQAGTSGYGAGATALIAGQGVTTNASGQFSLTGQYQCTPGTQVYVVSTGGNPGAGINNAATLMAGLGLCDNLSSSTYINMNEVTTVSSVWALAPFMNGVNIGAPSTNTAGLAAAFSDINTLVNIASGQANGQSPAGNGVVPVSQIYTLANILAACVNSTGAGDGGGCDHLFSYAQPSGGSLPQDTISSALDIARNPSHNVNNLLALSSTFSPFQPSLATAPDLTIAVSYTGGGLSSPSGLAIDAAGNVWAANAGNNSVTELSHAGAPLSGSTGFTAGSLNMPSGIAIDIAANVWIANAGNSTLTELNSAGANQSGSPFSGGGLSTPSSVAIDGLGNIWLANSGNNSASEFSATGTATSPAGTGYTAGGLSAPVGIAVNPR
jgi:hypothetical protein